MKAETTIFGGLALFFFPVGFIYGWLSNWEEHVGYLGLYLTGGLCALIAGYLWMTSRRIDERPEDDPTAGIEEAAGEQGFFSPHSWWPLPLAASAAVCFLGLAVGWWVFYVGAAMGALSVVGWVYEYYRGVHAH